MATPADAQAATIAALGAAPSRTARVSLPGWSWLTDPRVAAIYEPFGRYGLYGNAIKQFALGTGSTGFGNQFGTGIIDTSIPEFNVDEGGGGDGGGDGGGGGPSGGAGDIESGGGRGGQSSAGDVASGESGDPAHGGGTAVGGAPDFSYSDRERAIDAGLDQGGRSTTDRDLAQGSTGGGTEVGGADPSGGSGAFAEGGIVSKPTRALIGEGGEPEAVVPQHMLDDPDTLMTLLRNLARRSPLDDPGRKMSPQQRARWEALRR